MFKCPAFFSIPWKYVCDGKWDCPNGFYELVNSFCFDKRKACKTLFKCRYSQICIHFTDVCNSRADCPLADDESLCLLNSALCPPNCECLTFAVMCNGSPTPSRYDFTSFRIILLTNSKISRTLPLHSLISLSIQKSIFLDSICDVVSHSPFLVDIALPFNHISHLSKSCFDKSKFLVSISLDNNNLIALPKRVFSNLQQLKCVNISNNPLIEIWPDTFLDLPHLKIVSLLNLKKLAAQQLIITFQLAFLEASNYDHCCLAQSETTCSARKPWYFSCLEILPVSEHKIFFICFSVLIMVTNMVSLALQWLLIFKANDKKISFGVQIIAINLQDVVGTIPFIMLLSADTKLKRKSFHGNNHWNTSL